MKNNTIILFLFSLAVISPLCANEKELFPLDIKIYDSGEKVREKTSTNYPHIKIEPRKKSKFDPNDVLFFIRFEGNKYWNTSTFFVDEGKLIAQFYGWSGQKEQMKAQLSLTLKTLFVALGKDFNYIAKIGTRYKAKTMKTENIITPVLVWEKDDHYITFSFKVPSQFAKEEDGRKT